MGSLFKPKMPPFTTCCNPPTPPSAELSQEEKDRIAGRDQRDMERKRKGRKSTILTGPLGVEEEAETEKKTLLGS